MKRQRLEGIEKEILIIVSEVLLTEVRNTKIKGMISVSSVKMTPDSKFVDIAFSVLKTPGKKISKKEILEGLEGIKGFLRKRISQEMKLRHTPEVRVSLDETIENAMNIMKLLDQVKK